MKRPVPFPFSRNWRRIPHFFAYDCEVARVELRRLVATQRYVTRSKRSHRYPPIVVAHRGRLYIQDGHHRLARLVERGCKTATVLLGCSSQAGGVR